MNNRKDYNQIANYAYTQSEINIKIKDDAPCDYMKPMLEQASGGDLVYGGITDMDDLKRNLAENCRIAQPLFRQFKDIKLYLKISL